MNTLVLYDSYFGNTEKIAQAIAAALEPYGPVSIARVSQVSPAQLDHLDLLVVGSPTRAFRPSEATQKFLKSLPAGRLNGVKVAAFDTRINPEDTNSAILRFMVRIFGYAAQPIANQLKAKGGAPLLTPEGFIVIASEGPLKEGELERATQWAVALAQGLQG